MGELNLVFSGSRAECGAGSGERGAGSRETEQCKMQKVRMFDF